MTGDIFSLILNLILVCTNAKRLITFCRMCLSVVLLLDPGALLFLNSIFKLTASRGLK